MPPSLPSRKRKGAGQDPDTLEHTQMLELPAVLQTSIVESPLPLTPPTKLCTPCTQGHTQLLGDFYCSLSFIFPQGYLPEACCNRGIKVRFPSQYLLHQEYPSTLRWLKAGIKNTINKSKGNMPPSEHSYHATASPGYHNLKKNEIKSNIKNMIRSLKRK